MTRQIDTEATSGRVKTYALHDSDKSLGGVVKINRLDAPKWNARGYGIFHTVQTFYKERRIENLRYINAWAVDIDGGNKEEMLVKIKSGLNPTMVVESKNGFHVYWRATDATQHHWRAIMEHRLIPFYKADKKAKDLARLLRVPGYYHMKDPQDPFLIKVVHYQHVTYTEREMLQFYKDLETPKLQKKLHNRTKKAHPIEGDFWERVWNLNCEYALSRLSGSPYVAGEIYDFKQNTSGTLNIIVNNKSSSCWIDRDGRIGSMDEGGPTIAQWLNWFHKDYRKVVEIIKEVFPECQTQITLL